MKSPCACQGRLFTSGGEPPGFVRLDTPPWRRVVNWVPRQGEWHPCLGILALQVHILAVQPYPSHRNLSHTSRGADATEPVGGPGTGSWKTAWSPVGEWIEPLNHFPLLALYSANGVPTFAIYVYFQRLKKQPADRKRLDPPRTGKSAPSTGHERRQRATRWRFSVHLSFNSMSWRVSIWQQTRTAPSEGGHSGRPQALNWRRKRAQFRLLTRIFDLRA